MTPGQMPPPVREAKRVSEAVALTASRPDHTMFDVPTRRQSLLNKRLAEMDAEERAKALANAVYADCRSRCISDAGRRLVTTVLAALTEYEAATGRKYARRGKRVTAFATTVEGFLGDLMLARDNTVAGGWVFRPLHQTSFTGSDIITRAHLSAAIAGLEFLGLIERAPHFRRFGNLFVRGKKQLKGGGKCFRSTLKLTAMAREAGVDLGALAEHFRSAARPRGRSDPARRPNRVVRQQP
jgi:hypothetical protein